MYDEIDHEHTANGVFMVDRLDSYLTVWHAPAESHPFPAGLCWENARSFAAQNPAEYLYAEGIAFNRGSWSGHGWVVRRSDSEVIECTEGYETTEEYRGIAYEVDLVNLFIDLRPVHEGKTCREQWLTYEPDGVTIRSQAPGMFWILDRELFSEQIDIAEWWALVDPLRYP
jgi:hypothetical protein